ncbi:MAG: hypothetical protein ACHQHO_07630 [Solirubrobacterales bacterium]
MRRSARQKVAAAAAVAVVIGGGAFAAVSATGEGNRSRRADHRHAMHRLHPQDLLAAAGYLGISSRQLERELGSSKSLAQIAQAHAGKSAQGLIDAIVAARRARLAEVAARLPSRVGAEVNAPARLLSPGVARRAGALGPSRVAARLGSAAAGYLGVTAEQLHRELQSGKTLAQIADATPGKSSVGLVDALVAARKQRLARALAAGNVTPARAARWQSRLDRRMSAIVQRKFARAAKP